MRKTSIRNRRPKAPLGLSAAVTALIICLGLVAGCTDASTSQYREFTATKDKSHEPSAERAVRQSSPSVEATSSSPDATDTKSAADTVSTSPTAHASVKDDAANAASGNTPPAGNVASAASPPDSGNAAGVAPTTTSKAPDPIAVTPVKAAPPASIAPSPAKAADAKPQPPRKPEVLVKDRTFRTEGPQNALRVSYDDIDLLKVLNMEPVTPEALTLMPDWLKGLNGKRIRIRGFMYPEFEETGLKGFTLARDNQICCFGKDPKVYDVFRVELNEGVTTNYIQGRPFDVVGVFHIRQDASEWKLYGMYLIDNAHVIDR